MIEQLSLIEATQISDEWNADDWETPPEIAFPMAKLVLPTDKVILEPAAGTGGIVRFLPSGEDRLILANEINPLRYQIGDRQRYPAKWINSDFLEWGTDYRFDLMITNPPFSLGLEFVEHGLRFLNTANPTARLLCLLPIAFFSSQERCDYFESLDCRIYQRHRIRGRVAYLKNGVQMQGRQCDDCVYDIRPGKDGDAAPERVLNPGR
jgi:hypothetical protein